MIMFAWGANIFFKESRPPKDAMQIYVVAKQWMWKLQHMEGQRESTSCTFPSDAGQAHHDFRGCHSQPFFVPAFRTKQDVVPGRYSTTWFHRHQAG